MKLAVSHWFLLPMRTAVAVRHAMQLTAPEAR